MNQSSDVPLVEVDGQWRFRCPPKSILVCGTHFDSEHGYCVAIAFGGSSRANYVTSGYAHAVAEQLRDAEDGDGVVAFADRLDLLADEMAFQNIIWEIAGRPADGIDDTMVGRA